MDKAIFYNMKEKFPIHEIIGGKTFEPEFGEWSDEEYNEISKYKLIVAYFPRIDLDIVKRMRRKLHFLNKRIIIFTDELDRKLKKDTLENGANYVSLFPEDIDELNTILTKTKESLDSNDGFNKDKLTPFKSAIYEIFSMMALANIELVDEYLCTSRLHFGDITGLMSLAGKKKGLILLTINTGLAKKIISSIMGAEVDDLTEDETHDGVAEIVNMVSGGAKARLSESEDHFMISAPTVITGVKHRVIQPKDMPCVVLVYKLGDEYFAVKLCLLNLVQD